MKKIYILACLLAFFATGLAAQSGKEGQINYSNSVSKQGNTVSNDFKADLSGLKLGRQEMIVLTPTVRAREGMQEETKAPIVVAGPKRYRMLMREIGFGEKVFDKEPAMIIKRNRRMNERLDLKWDMPYAQWQRNAEFVVIEETRGCPSCGRAVDMVKVSDMLAPLYIPEFSVSFINPPVEEVKRRSESYTAHLNFQVGKYTLLRDFKNNKELLARVDDIMKQLVNDPDLTVTEFNVTGFASPEGSVRGNQVLSENRAKAFLSYLKGNFGFNVGKINSKGMGEDWDGLYAAVQASDMADRDTVLGIISGTQDIALRKRQLETLSGGATYRYMLANLYPPLRRIVYEISFIARGFDVQEAREIVRTKPHLLSQNEIFLLAETHPKGSEEFNEIFRIAARVFPSDPYANINYGAISIQEGRYDEVIERLSGVSMTEAYNNLAIAHFNKGNSDLAERYFKMAADGGSPEGIRNLAEFNKWKENF